MVYAIRFCGLAVLGAHLGNPAAAPDPVAEGYVHCKDPGHDEDSVSREADALDRSTTAPEMIAAAMMAKVLKYTFTSS